MKFNWIHSVAVAIGVCAIPSIASAQYTNGNPNVGPIAQYGPRTAATPGGRSYMAPGNGSSMVSYPQQGAIGSGISGDGHVHVPPQNQVLDNPLLNVPYPSNASAQAPMQSEQMVAPNHAPQPVPQPQYQTPYPSPYAPSTGSCPACANGNCSVHGSVIPGGAAAITGYSNYLDHDSCGTSSCGVAAAPSMVSPSPWIFGASGLLFNRIDHHNVRLTSNPAAPDYALINTADARMQATGGIQLSAGRYFGCGQYAMVASYWGIFSNPQTYAVQSPVGGSLRSDLPFTLRGPGNASVPYGIQYGPVPTFVYDMYDNAFAHRIVRDQQYNNVEINFFSFALGGGARQPYNSGCGTSACNPCGGSSCGGSSCGPCGTSSCASGLTGPCAPWYGAQCSKLRLNMYGGIRWFQFKDSLEYAASRTDAIYGNTVDDFYYRNGVNNNLVGFQIGSLATYCCGSRCNFYAGSAFGIYGNHMTANTFAGTGVATATILSTNSFNGRPYDYSSSRTDVAFLGEGTVGTGIRICNGLTGNIGYRVVGVTGVATAVGQIPRNFSNGADVSKINNYDSLILHGLVLGATYNF